MQFLFRSEVRGDHIHVDVFAGPDADHLAKIGKITVRLSEYSALYDLLTKGRKSSHKVNFKIKEIV